MENLTDLVTVTALTNGTTTSTMNWRAELHDKIFVITHIVINSLLVVIGLSTSMTLFIKNTKQFYSERRLRAIWASESQLLTVSIVFCSLYLPSMTAEFLGVDYVYGGLFCHMLIWIYGSLHATVFILHSCLAVCWMVRVLWPNINHRTHNTTLYVTLVVSWIIPALVMFVHVLVQNGDYSLPSEVFCMSDLEFPVYLPGFVMPIALVAMTCYIVCFVALKQWRHLQYEISPRIVSVVVLPTSEHDAMNAHCLAFFMFTTCYLIWKSLFILFPAGDFYTPVVLHVSFILSPLTVTLSHKSLYEWLRSPFYICIQLCAKKEETTQSDSEAVAAVVNSPPPYSEVVSMPRHQQLPDAVELSTVTISTITTATYANNNDEGTENLELSHEDSTSNENPTPHTLDGTLITPDRNTVVDNTPPESLPGAQDKTVAGGQPHVVQEAQQHNNGVTNSYTETSAENFQQPQVCLGQDNPGFDPQLSDETELDLHVDNTCTAAESAFSSTVGVDICEAEPSHLGLSVYDVVPSAPSPSITSQQDNPQGCQTDDAKERSSNRSGSTNHVPVLVDRF